MTRTLEQLRIQVEKLIKQQGKTAPVAARIYTKEDVIDYPDEETNVTEEIANKVIDSLDNYDHIYTVIFDCIDDELRELKVL